MLSLLDPVNLFDRVYQGHNYPAPLLPKLLDLACYIILVVGK